MSKKQDSFYFDNFLECARLSCQAAHLLKTFLTDFEVKDMDRKLDEIHSIEHSADDITPIEREDIAQLSHNIDEMTDKIEEVFIRIYMNNVQTIRPEAVAMLDLIIRCCEEVCSLLEEFPNFRRSKKLKEYIIRINTLEEEADQLFISNMRKLHTEEEDLFSVIAWREIYTYLEKCADACEHVADGVESVVMNNS